MASSLGKLIVVLVLVAGLGNGFLRLEDSGSPDSNSEVSVFHYFAQLALTFVSYLAWIPQVDGRVTDAIAWRYQ